MFVSQRHQLVGLQDSTYASWYWKQVVAAKEQLRILTDTQVFTQASYQIADMSYSEQSKVGSRSMGQTQHT